MTNYVTKEQVKGFIEESNLGIVVKSVDFLKFFSFGEIPIMSFEVESQIPINNYFIVFITIEENPSIPNAIYNINLFNQSSINQLEIDIYNAIFTYHIGNMVIGRKIAEQIAYESSISTKH